MIIFIIFILSLISLSLRLMVTGISLGIHVEGAVSKPRSSDKSTVGKITAVGISATNNSLKFLHFVVSKLRNILLLIVPHIIVIDLIIFTVLMASSAGAIALFTTTDESGGLIFDEDAMASLGSSKSEGDNEGSSSSSSEDVTKPEGISSDSWNSADDVGKKIAAFAYKQIQDPPNGEPMRYGQGVNEIGVYDCSTFVCAVLEGSVSKTFSGEDCDTYDFHSMHKGNLSGYLYTGAMQGVVNGKSESKIGHYPDNPDLAKPGDILLSSSHVMIYLGRKEDGTDVVVHASSSSGGCSSDVSLSDSDLQVGISVIWSKNCDIVRPSKLLGL